MTQETTSNTLQAQPQETAYYVVLKTGSTQIVGWQNISYDEGSSIPTYSVPEGYESILIADMTESTWFDLRHNQNGCGGGLAYENGKIIPYAAPAPAIPLKEQAATALQQARNTVYNNYGILNEPTPDAWVSYLKALMAIENGTDTTSTSLPSVPNG